MRKRALTDLCGGRSAMAVPTATVGLPAPPMQHIRIDLQSARHLGNRYSVFQPPDTGQLELLREQPA